MGIYGLTVNQECLFEVDSYALSIACEPESTPELLVSIQLRDYICLKLKPSLGQLSMAGHWIT